MSKKILLTLIMGILIGGGTGLGIWWWGIKSAVATEPPAKEIHYVEYPANVVMLQDDISYLQAQWVVEVHTKEDVAHLDSINVPLRARWTMTLSEQSIKELLKPEGKQQLQQHLLEDMQAVTKQENIALTTTEPKVLLVSMVWQ